MGKSVAAPPPVNYQAAAQAQGAANVDAARTTARLSNPNINGPLGSQRVSYGTFDEAGYNKALADYNAAGNQGTYDETGQFVPGATAPTREQFTANQDTPTITQTLTPEAQRTLEAQQQVQYQLANLGQQGIGTAQKVMGTPFEFKGPDIQTGLGNTGQVAQGPNLGLYGMAGANVNAQGANYGPSAGQYGYAQSGPSAGQYGSAQGGPQAGQYGYAQGNLGPQQQATGGPAAGSFGLQQGGVQGPQLQQQIDTGGPLSGGPAVGQYGYAQGGPGGPQLQSRLDTSNLAQMPVNAGTTAQQAIMSRLDPQLERQRAQLETQLANQGLVRGGEAYNEALKMQGQQENDLRTQAALQGLNLDMSARQQGLGEQQALGNFGNQASLSQFGAGQQASQAQNAAMAQNYAQAQAAAQQGNAAQQQQFNQRVQAGEFGNQAQLASFNANLQNQQAGNQAASNNFAQAQAAAQMGNQAAGQNYAQALGAGQFANQAIAQNFGQAQAAGQMGNQAVAQNFGQGQAANQAFNQAVQQNMAQGLTAAQAQNQAAQQIYSQLMGVAGLQNQAIGQNQNAALQQQAAQNSAQAQQFNQALQSAQFGNTAQQQALAQQMQLRNQPLNEISALMSGSQIQMPQFQGYTGSNVAAAPVFQGVQAQGQDAINRYNVAQSANNALTSGLFGLGGAALGGAMMGGPGSVAAGLFSDRRLKSNIKRVGTHSRGFGVYEYDIFGRRERGVLAQEVAQVFPDAVAMHPSGFLMVNYGAL